MDGHTLQLIFGEHFGQQKRCVRIWERDWGVALQKQQKGVNDVPTGCWVTAKITIRILPIRISFDRTSNPEVNEIPSNGFVF